MDTPLPHALFVELETLSDPRSPHRRQHKLVDLVTIALCAVLSGADSWVDVAEWGRSKEPWLRTFLELPAGIASHDTFSRLFRLLDPQALEAVLLDWVRATLPAPTGQSVIAVDGKTLRRSHDRATGQTALHLISAWATESGLALGQWVVPDHTNEITALPTVLEAVVVPGTVITLDAMGCQREVAETIVTQGGAYVLALKGNQNQLHADVRDFFVDGLATGFAAPIDQAETVEKGHGRIEKRVCWASEDANLLRYLDPDERWAGMRSVAMVQAERRIGNDRSVERRYYLSSLPADALRLNRIVRTHWQIENQLHWVLDTAFAEDQCRVRMGDGAQNLALLRKVALSLLKRDATAKLGIAGKRRKAGWDEQYLLHILTQ
ncbi:MAG: ISAs1 family transposase [Thermomicrobiales bacterium]|nr:ISAs1 family transposase [Thermomicrobiales bacterium]